MFLRIQQDTLLELFKLQDTTVCKQTNLKLSVSGNTFH